MKEFRQQALQRARTLIVMLLVAGTAFAQQITVQGHVKDALGELTGVNVFEQSNPTSGVTTDINGNFTLRVKKGAMLTFSFVGYTTQVLPATERMNVTLIEDSKLLEDVMVIGYGVVKKSDATGSVTAIEPDEMSKGITNNATDMMVGKIAGVDVITSGGAPGAGAQVRIRGGASLNASNDPLYVIDGLVIDAHNGVTGMSNPLAMINTNDIETFTVLKDASATAIYGSRASNGVIIITTKKGKAGAEPKVTYNGSVTVSTTQKRYDMLDASAYKNLVTNIMGESYASLLGNADTDWQDEIFRTAVSTDHSISISGGTKYLPYRLSVGANLDRGIIKTSHMNRYNASLNLSPSLFDNHLNLNVTGKFMNENDRYVDYGGAVGSALAMPANFPVYDASNSFTGGYYQNMQNASFSDPSWTSTTNPNSPQNPVALLNQYVMYATTHDFTGNFEADYKIHGFEDLRLHGSFGGEYTEGRQTTQYSPYSFSNNYYGYDGMTKTYKYNIVASGYAQYYHDFENMHLDIMGGAEESHYHRNGYSYGQGTDPYTGEAYGISLRSENEWATHNSLVSYFGRLNYSLLDRYLLTFTVRRDGSSRFSKDNRWGTFPSLALAWRISNEPFWKSEAWNDFKLRLGWGKTGQQDIGSDFLYTSVYTGSNSYAMYPFGTTYYYTTRPSASNPDLTWEKTTTWNAGLDFGFLNNRITASIDGYIRKTTDLINTVTIPIGTNFASVLTENIGSLENKGLEFTINAKPVVTKNFLWDVAYNVTWNHNEITELINGDNENYRVMSGSTISRGNATQIQAQKVGYAANSFYVYQQVYDENGKPLEGVYVDRNADGQINESDRYMYKDPAADVYMGFTSKMEWKNWDFSFALRASLGNYVYYDFLSNHASVSSSGLYSNSAFSNTTQEAVDLGFTGTSGSEYYLSDYFVRNASFLKCTNITLGYSFYNLFRKYNYDGLNGRIYATLQNPFIITKYDGLDPEVAGGIDRNPYPRPFSCQLGLTLNF